MNNEIVTEKKEVNAPGTLQTIFERRAVRKYLKQPVSRELLEKLIEAGCMAPSAINRQPWKFYVLTKREDITLYSKEIKHGMVKVLPKLGLKNVVKSAVEGIKHLSFGIEFMKEEDPVFHGAPAVIFITASKDNEWASLDVGMCAQNIMLAAKAFGLDTCPVGFGKFVMETESYPKLGVSEDEQVLLSVIVGYGNEKPELHPRKKDNVKFL